MAETLQLRLDQLFLGEVSSGSKAARRGSAYSVWP